MKLSQVKLAWIFMMAGFPAFAGTPAFCANLPKDAPSQARFYAELAQISADPREKSKFVQAGMAAAKTCLAQEPSHAACLYYHSINLGLDLQARILGIKKDLERMAADFKKANDLSPGLDGGGPSRALGYLYMELPPFGFGADLQRDLEKATKYAEQALAQDSRHPDNHLLMGLILAKQNKWPEAIQEFTLGLNYFKTVPTVVPLFKSVKADLEKNLAKAQRKVLGTSKNYLSAALD